ncbi:ANTAR domain-containing protein [Arthrobacter sp. TmT3-37]
MAEQNEGCKASDPDGGDPVQRSMDELIASLREQTQKVEQLQEALASRDLISQAKGILMGRLKISADEAFALLCQTSNQTNVKLYEIAQRVVHEGSIDGYL